MYTLLVILICLVAVLMICIVLIQESKGGGLSSSFASYNQIGGVRKTTDFIEQDKGKIVLNETPEFVPQITEGTDEGGKDGEEGFFTETLARIYIKQGRYNKALDILHRLNAGTQQKNAYIADQIRFLEKLIINNNKK